MPRVAGQPIVKEHTMQCAGGRYDIELIREFEREGEGYVTIGLTLPRAVLLAWAKHELRLLAEGYGAESIDAWQPTSQEALDCVGNRIALDLHPRISEVPDAVWPHDQNGELPF